MDERERERRSYRKMTIIRAKQQSDFIKYSFAFSKEFDWILDRRENRNKDNGKGLAQIIQSKFFRED